jgi:hypothetical protein
MRNLMRNDARPIGEDSPASPLGGDHRPDSHESVTDECQSHVVDKEAEEDTQRADHDVELTPPVANSK